jgi:hypothetical protein
VAALIELLQTIYALTCTETSSGTRREFCKDLIASSAMNFPMTSASLRLVVMRMGVGSIRCTNSGVSVPPRFSFTTNLVFFIDHHYFYSTLRNRTPRSVRRGSAFPGRSKCSLGGALQSRRIGVPLIMSRSHLEWSAPLDLSVAADVLMRQEPDEEEDEEEDEGNRKGEDDDDDDDGDENEDGYSE